MTRLLRPRLFQVIPKLASLLFFELICMAFTAEKVFYATMSPSMYCKHAFLAGDLGVTQIAFHELGHFSASLFCR